MAKVIVQSTSEGVMVSAETLRKAGLNPGGLIEVEVTALPEPRDIVSRALQHCAKTLGNAVGAAWPRWMGDAWVVDLKSPDGARIIGQLYFDPHGVLISDRSTTYDSAQEAVGASNPTVPAA